jgi:hypothetical protein
MGLGASLGAEKGAFAAANWKNQSKRMRLARYLREKQWIYPSGAGNFAL